MDLGALNQFVSGAFMMGAAAVALFFFEYWRKTRDRLFAILSLAFVLLAVERTLLAFLPPSTEGRHWVFAARFVVFVLIMAGIVDKNRPRVRARVESEPPAGTRAPRSA